MGTFDGKVVIVTGGALGMGRDTAIEFGREGASVVVADINADAGKATVRDAQRAGGKAALVTADVAKAADCKRVVDEAVRSFGAVDILFNNVGIQPPRYCSGIMSRVQTTGI